MVDFSIDCKTTDNKTLDELSKQIERRTRILNETSKDAVNAIAIQTTKSLRAATKVSKGKLHKITSQITDNDLGISLKERTDLIVGWRREGNRNILCVKQGGHYVPQQYIWWQIYANNWQSAKCYEVELSEGRYNIWHNEKDTRQKKWILVSYETTNAENRLKFLYEKLVKGASGIKRAGLTTAMQKISDKKQKLEYSSGYALLDKMIVVLKDMQAKDPNGIESQYAITVIDNLINAGKIVGGEAGVTRALQKALNSTNGYLNAYIKKHPEQNWFGEIYDKPFPPEAMT